MADFEKIIGRDEVAELLASVRSRFSGKPIWCELESVVYDTLKEFGELPAINEAVKLPGRFTEDEPGAVDKAISAYVRQYGERCRRDLLWALVLARVDLALAKKATQ